MKNLWKLGLLSAACAALLFMVTTVNAMKIAPPAPGVRAATATVIVVGKVESIEEKTVAAKPFPGATEKAEYKIAVIKVEDPILGAKGVTYVRVGFVLPPPPPMGKPGGPIRIGGPGRYNLTFAKDQEGIFFLTPHADGNFLIAQTYNDFVNKQGNPNFDKEVAETKKFIKILDNPKDSLKADKQEERFTAAAILISKYRHQRDLGAEKPKTEAVDGDISKLILTALGEADWKAQNPSLFRMNPQMIFMQLGVTEKDGFTPPMMEVKGQPQKVIDIARYADYAKQWCKDNAGKYKIQRFVYEEKKEKSDK